MIDEIILTYRLKFYILYLMQTLESKTIFNSQELAKAQVELIEKKYGVLPDVVREDGYYYELKKFDQALEKYKNDNSVQK